MSHTNLPMKKSHHNHDPNNRFKKILFAVYAFILVALFLVFYHFEDSYSQKLIQELSEDTHVENQLVGVKLLSQHDITHINSITPSSKGFLVSGSSYKHAGVIVMEFGYDWNILWRKNFQGHFYVSATELQHHYLVTTPKSPFDDDIRPGSYLLDKSHKKIIKTFTDTFSSVVACDDGFIARKNYNELYRFDRNGKIVWKQQLERGEPMRNAKTHDKDNNPLTHRGSIGKIIKTSDNYYVATGYVLQKNAEKPSPSLIKFDSNGHVLWEKIFVDQHVVFNDMIESEDGGFMLTSRTNGIEVFKTDRNGVLQWNRLYYKHPKRSYAYLWAITGIGDNHYLISGQTGSDILINIRASGEVAWTQTLNRNGYDSIRNLMSLPDRGVLLGGDSKNLLAHNSGDSAWLMKIDWRGHSKQEVFENIVQY